MELANIIIQALGIIIAAASSLVVAVWQINKALEKQANNIYDKFDKQNDCFKKEFEYIKEFNHQQNINLLEHQKSNDNKFNEIRIEFMQEKDRILQERAVVINEIWDSVNKNENTVNVIESQIINIENKFNAIITTQTKMENKIDDLYEKFNEVTKYLRNLIEKK